MAPNGRAKAGVGSPGERSTTDAENVLRIVIPIVIQIGLENRKKANRNSSIGSQAIPANGTTLSNNQNVLLEPFPSFGFVDLGQDRLAGRSRLGSNAGMHPLPGADVYDYQRHSRQGKAV